MWGCAAFQIFWKKKQAWLSASTQQIVYAQIKNYQILHNTHKYLHSQRFLSIICKYVVHHMVLTFECILCRRHVITGHRSHIIINIDTQIHRQTRTHTHELGCIRIAGGSSLLVHCCHRHSHILQYGYRTIFLLLFNVNPQQSSARSSFVHGRRRQSATITMNAGSDEKSKTYHYVAYTMRIGLCCCY